MLGRKQWQGIIWNLENDLLTCLTDFISNKFYFQTNNFSDNNRDLMILTAKDSHLSGSTHLKNISQLFTPWRPNPIPHQTDLPPSEVNNKKIFETITWVHLGNVESLPFLTVHVQSSYSLHMPTPLKQMANQDMPFPPPPKKKQEHALLLATIFQHLIILLSARFFWRGAGSIYVFAWIGRRSTRTFLRVQQNFSSYKFLLNIAERKSSYKQTHHSWVPGRDV